MNKILLFPPRNFLKLRLQRRFFNHKRIRISLLIIGCILILAWQYFFYVNVTQLDKQYTLKAASGLHQESVFVYFYYYLRLFPLAPESDYFLVNSKDGAKKIFLEHADNLRTEWTFNIRSGELGQMFLFLLDAFLKGEPDNRGCFLKTEFPDTNLLQQLLELRIIKTDRDAHDYAIFNDGRIHKSGFNGDDLIQQLVTKKIISFDVFNLDYVYFKANQGQLIDEKWLIQHCKQIGINEDKITIIREVLKKNYTFLEKENKYLLPNQVFNIPHHKPDSYFQTELEIFKNNFNFSDNDVNVILEVWKRSHLSVRPLHRLIFVFSLLALFVAFWLIRHPVLGIITVILIGSNPFQLYEVYVNENVFGWMISTTLIIFALHLPLLAERKLPKYYLWTIPVLTGLILGTIRQVRSEPVIIIVSAAVSYLLISKTKWRVKGALLLLLFLSFFATGNGWKFYFNHKYEESSRRLKAVGGHPYEGPRQSYHVFWHAAWCGLGDFGQKYGYCWADGAAAKYSLPFVMEKYKNTDLPVERFSGLSWKKGKYLERYYDLPYYTKVLRKKIINDITNDPLWYLSVLMRRGWRIISEATPVRISIGNWWIKLPINSILSILVLAFLILRKSWMMVRLICFTFPLFFPAFLIFSGGNMNYYSCFHLIVAAILGAWLIECVFWFHRLKQPLWKIK